MADAPSVTYLFSDIEGSTRLWESDPEGASRAVAWHDGISRETVQAHRGTVVKMTGDGMHAAFDDARAAVAAAIDLQLALAAPLDGLKTLEVRCGLHLGADQRRDNDYFGPAVNRAARIMSAAHGGQILLSQAVHDRISQQLPEGVALRDLGDVRLKDLGAPERLYQIVHRSLRSEFPALRSLASVPNNLPQQLDRFIGREREIDEVRALLRDARLVTLCAMGGVGKSRLSIQLGAEVLDDFRDGVWLVELAPLVDSADIAQAVASVLGVKEEPGGGLVPALERFVRERSMLLILDNCEHMVQGVADLAKRLLQSGAGLKILATTRDPLHIAGERLVHLPTLNVPGEGESLERLHRHASVQLFAERATAVQPAFRLTEKNAPAVSEICRRLDGIPLALELAAARVRSLPVETLASRLDQRFRLLTTPDRTVLPRQRTLRALIDWSHDLLDERERAVFRRLAVFAGGWTLESGEAVVAGDGVPTDDVVDLLSSLVEKSLVAMEAEGGRYRMLDTVRHYALERLAESGDGAAARTRHLRWYLALAETAWPQLVGPQQGAWLSRLDLERENLLAAHRWCDAADHGGETGLQMVFLLKLYWYQRGLLTLGHRVTLEALQRVGSERSVLRCRGLADVGQFCSFMGRSVEACTYLEESLAIARELGNVRRVAAVLQPLGIAYLSAGELVKAEACFAEAIDTARVVADARQLASALSCQAQLLRHRNELEATDELYAEILRIAEVLGDQESAALARLGRAMVEVDRADLDAARLDFKQALDVALAIGSQLVGQSALDAAAAMCAATGRYDEAAQFIGAADAQAERSGLRRDVVDSAFVARWMRRAREATGEAAFRRAEAAGADWPYDDAMARARTLAK